MKRAAKPKKIAYQLIERDTELGQSMYRQLAQLINANHSDLKDARIALAWCTSWKPDVDGRMTIGKCKKASDLDRELAAFDFIILLSQAFWIAASDQQRTALMDHELCHAAVKYGLDGEPVVDERGRVVYRTRKHDVEEFSSIIERHGIYKRDLEAFARAMERAKMQDQRYWVGVPALVAKLAEAGFEVAPERVKAWGQAERRAVQDWLHLRAELVDASVGAAASIPPPPPCVQAVGAPLLETTH